MKDPALTPHSNHLFKKILLKFSKHKHYQSVYRKYFSTSKNKN